ncbi:unnamed protein product [Rotaria socialis]|uniref:Uncharacterized protein n=1 Tax=Rotaria socialis TaxID=392032 RepID=A0A821SJA9_9BILA|nr:unnamed protein product [Rotaria socialis]CAF4860488.1 unnamed protein product [Rotaria socialis]
MRWCSGATQGNMIVGGNDRGKQANQLIYPIGLPFDQHGNLSIDGTYRVNGHTINSYDGNKTIITSMMLRLTNGRLWASGCYDSGTNYNTEKSVV